MTFSFETVRSKEINKEGSRIKFASIAKSKVAETKPPSATVPPNSEIIKIENPKNKTMDV